MKSKKIAIVDADSFYVSCERIFNPISIGRPTVVLSNNDGCVIARSKEAKDLGIKMGEPFFQKRDFMEQHRFCVYSSNYNLYGDMSDRVMETIKSITPKIEVYSIDECFIDLSDVPNESLTQTLTSIKNEVFRKVGIPVSIGVGPNKTLAKLTSKIAKKQPEYAGICSFWDILDFRHRCYSIPADEIWGIGRKWSKKLKDIGVESVGQFMMQDKKTIQKLMNVNGAKTLMELQGFYCYEINLQPKLKKNIASTRSFGSDISDFEQLSAAMYSYIESGVKKLLNNEIIPIKATIFISGNVHKGQKHHKSKQIMLQKQTRDVNEIWSQVFPHLKSMYDKNKTYKKCGIVFNNLMPEHVEQITLFQESYQSVIPPLIHENQWKMKQDFITQKYTTSWDEIPTVYV